MFLKYIHTESPKHNIYKYSKKMRSNSNIHETQTYKAKYKNTKKINQKDEPKR